MMLRLLNHHLTEMRKISKITLANWQCLANGCGPPLEALTRRGRSDARPVILDHIPGAWMAANAYLNDAELSIVETDQSYLNQSSVEHLINRVEVQTDDAVPRQAYKRVRSKQTSSGAETRVKDWIEDAKRTAGSVPIQLSATQYQAAVKTVLDWLDKYPFRNKLKIRDKSVFTPPLKRKDPLQLSPYVSRSSPACPTGTYPTPDLTWSNACYRLDS